MSREFAGNEEDRGIHLHISKNISILISEDITGSIEFLSVQIRPLSHTHYNETQPPSAHTATNCKDRQACLRVTLSGFCRKRTNVLKVAWS
ncbi:hypothetical protein TNCV_3176021 [Trichonephila clavipes]|nr:hypothetical protein TNCV_3176021 [Trichonephila clavipes]